MKHMVEDGETCLCGFHLQTYLEDTHHLIPGTVLKGRYQVGAAIGEGGFGITYIGMDTLFSQKVAIKEFYIREFVNRNNTVTANVSVITGNSVSTFDNFKAKFISEARTLAKFSKEEGIVSVIDYFEENNTAYIVMEYLEGQTLRAYLKKEQVLSWGRTLQILTPVMKSLGKVHAEGIVHRDIAPDNIMLTTDGKVKLLDFGAARVVDSGDLHSRSMVLKQGYAPIEQYRTNGNLQGSWTDVYALCATIYVCVTGILPEDGMERYIEDHLKPAHTLVNCPKEFSDILMKGMAVKYQERYQTVGELYEAFTTMFKKPEPEVKQEEPEEEEEKTVIAVEIHKPEPAVKSEPSKVEIKPAQESSQPEEFDLQKISARVNRELARRYPEEFAVHPQQVPSSGNTPPIQKTAVPVKKKSAMGLFIAVIVVFLLGAVGASMLFAGSSKAPEPVHTASTKPSMIPVSEAAPGMVENLNPANFTHLNKETESPEDVEDVLERIMNKGVLTVGMDADYPPFTYLDDDGKPVGIEVEIAQLLADELGVELEIQFMDYDRLWQSLDSIDLIMAGVLTTPERQESFGFTRPYSEYTSNSEMRDPYYADSAIAFAKDGTDALKEYLDNVFLLEHQSELDDIFEKYEGALAVGRVMDE